MKDNCVDIAGIAKSEEFAKISKNYPFSEICETYNFHIPQNKPNIHRILKFLIDASIKESKLIDAPLGKRSIIEGMLHIKVFYSADKYSNKIHFVHIDVPIYTFLELGNKVDIGILIEDAVIHKLDSRNISISTMLFVYPILEEIDLHEHSNADKEKYVIDEFKDKEQDSGIYHYNIEDFENTNFNSHDGLEFNIEYDMNECNLDETFLEDKKESCECE
jgi:hypothetical protein